MELEAKQGGAAGQSPKPQKRMQISEQKLAQMSRSRYEAT
jgi:hypothetical protein